MSSDQDIANAFRWLLNREPESQEVIDQFKRLGSIDAIRRAIMATDEFFNEVRSNGKLVPNNTWVCRDLTAEHSFKIWGNLFDKGVSVPAIFGEYEPIETRLVRAILSPGDHVLDIGANIGWFTLTSAARVGASGRVVSFEPSPYIFPWLARSVADSGFADFVDLYRFAVSDENGFLLLDPGELGQNPGGASVRSMSELSTGNTHHLVRSIQGDDFLDYSPHFIKIDVEGAEMRALSGFRSLIERSRPIILCEINPVALRHVSGCEPIELLTYFDDLGYAVCALGDDRLIASNHDAILGTTREWYNVVFAPKEMVNVYTEMRF